VRRFVIHLRSPQSPLQKANPALALSRSNLLPLGQSPSSEAQISGCFSPGSATEFSDEGQDRPPRMGSPLKALGVSGPLHKPATSSQLTALAYWRWRSRSTPVDASACATDIIGPREPSSRIVHRRDVNTFLRSVDTSSDDSWRRAGMIGTRDPRAACLHPEIHA